MIEADKYYEKTETNKPSPLLKKFFMYGYNKQLTGSTAIDLGCGAGNDTLELINNGFHVTAIDNERGVKEILERRVLNSEKLNVIIDDFSKIELPKADLISANMSLFFVKNNFDMFIENMLKSINKKGFFIGNFLGKEDDWANSKTTVEKEELLNFLKDFKMFYFSEEKYYRDTALGENKFWHVYTVIAQLES